MCENEMTHKLRPVVICPAEATLVAGAYFNTLLCDALNTCLNSGAPVRRLNLLKTLQKALLLIFLNDQTKRPNIASFICLQFKPKLQ